MKKLKYQLRTVAYEKDSDGNIMERESFTWKMVTDNEAGRAMAEQEAWGGVIEEFDDGKPEPVKMPSQEQRIAELEEALDMLLNGVTE